jgi:diguanylate cyclase (GGDEF)-like protein
MTGDRRARTWQTETGRSLALVVLVLFVAWIGWVDMVTGVEVGMSLFYLIPVVMAGWWLGPMAAAICAAASTIAWLTADLQATERASLLPSLWNGFTRLIIFTVMGLLVSRVRTDHSRLRDLLDREKTLARTDAVTGLMNHRGFLETLMREASRCRRAEQPLCLAFMDLDNFKQVNDRYGHAAGDTLLARIARAIRETVRGGDVPARLGGDEFVVLFWDVDRAAVEGIAQRIIDRVRMAGEEYPEAELGASVGIAFFGIPPDSVEEILKRADNAMYEAKTMGKGLFAVWSSPRPVRPGAKA